MNRLDQLFERKKEKILNIYFTAGFPETGMTADIIKYLAAAGVDIIEIGIPFSDSLADGPVIQHSNNLALKNGMNLQLLFEQLNDIRKTIDIPLILMGSLNPIMQFGINQFCENCRDIGIDGVIIPDLPIDVYIKEYKDEFEANGLCNILLITPETSEERIRLIDCVSKGFVYLVSSSSTTGIKEKIVNKQEEYFRKVKAMNLKNPRLIGFGISDNESYVAACNYANGAVIGSAFINTLIKNNKDQKATITEFVNSIIKKKD